MSQPLSLVTVGAAKPSPTDTLCMSRNCVAKAWTEECVKSKVKTTIGVILSTSVEHLKAKE